MATLDQEICCHVTPVDKIEPEDAIFSCNMFAIEVLASFMPPLDESAMEEDESELYDMGCDLTRDIFLIERDTLFQDETSSSTIREILVDMNVPVESCIIDRILTFARQMETNKTYMGRKVLHLRVEIDVPPSFMAMDDGDDDDGGGDLELGSIPASKASIEALEKIKTEDLMNCSICLEEIRIGSEGTRMPCLHVYHSPCILKWLEISRACPLCRSEIS